MSALVMADIDSSECVQHCTIDFDSLYKSAFSKGPSESLVAGYSRRIKSTVSRDLLTLWDLTV